MGTQTLRDSTQSGRCWKRGGGRCCGASKTGLAPWPKSKGEALQLADESVVAILWQLSDLDILGVRRYLSLESYVITDMSSLWADLEAGPSG